MIGRNAILYGGEVCEKLGGAVAAICGCGAVGSFAAEALARLGVGRFRLYDCDCFEASNINRQLCALSSTVGADKVEVQKKRILDINPSAQVEANKVFIDAAIAAEIARAKPSVIVDAIDCIEAKIALALAASAAGTPIVSSMGAARRKNPLAVKTADIYKTSGCPMAARIRKELRRLGARGFQCVYSDEPARRGTHLRGEAGEGMPAGKKTMGSSVVVTGVFGLNLANLALREIAGGDF